jgi:O-antigen ligase
MRIWAGVHSILALMVVCYVLGQFGSEVFVSEDRGPFQVAVRDLLPAWPNYFALAMGVAICVLFAHVLANRAGPFTWFQLTALFAGLLISFSRSGWLVCFASLLVMSVASGRLRRAMPVFVMLGLIAILVGTQIPGIRYQIQASLTPGTSQSVTLVRRVAFAVEALRIWWRDPMVGIGFARFDQYATLAELSRISAVGARGVETLGSVHNEYLSTLLKGGLITVVGFAAFLIGATRRLWRLARDRNVPEALRWLAITGLGITSVLLIGGLGAESFRTLSSSAAFWILVGGLSTAPVGAPAMEKSPS